jgi:Leucine-rich repeat (LRR) protein
MINIFYIPASGSATSSISVSDSDNLNSNLLFNNATLQITSSAYSGSGSFTTLSSRVNIISNGLTLVSYPEEYTTIQFSSSSQSPFSYDNLIRNNVVIPLTTIPPTASFSSFFNYSFNNNNTLENTSFRIYTSTSQSVGDKYATGSKQLSGLFANNTEARINYAGTNYRFIAQTPPLNSDYPPYLYFFDRGVKVGDTANNLSEVINRAISGYNASSSVNLIYAYTSSTDTITFSGSLSGSYANGITFSTGSSSNFTLQTTLLGGTDKILLLSQSIINVTQSLNSTSNLYQGTYFIEVTGSGKFYTSSILFTNTQTQNTTYLTASNNYLTTSIYITSSSRYLLTAKTETSPYMSLTYTSMPISASGSTSDWNTYLGIGAASSSLTSNKNIDLIGGNLSNISTLIVSASTLTNFSSFGLNNIISCSLAGNGTSNVLTSFPTIISSSRLIYFDVNSNRISGSILNFTSSTALQSFIADNNRISGSISNLLSILPTSSINNINISSNYLTGSIIPLSSSALNSFNCSNNRLSGSISSLSGSNSLQYFNCSNNALIGNIPNISNATSLHSFNCSNNKLSGSIPEVSSSYVLETFNCSNNYLINNLPQFTTGSSILTSFDCSYNRLSGSIPTFTSSYIQTFNCSNNYLSGSINLPTSSYTTSFYFPPGTIYSSSVTYTYNSLTNFDCSYNRLSGSIITLNGCYNLNNFNCSYNSLTGSIPSLNDNINLRSIILSNNKLSGSLPLLNNNINLNYVDVSYNNIVHYDGVSGTPNPTLFIPISLTEFNAQGNALDQGSVDELLKEFDYVGATGGTLYLNGGTNSSPSAGGLSYTASLVSKGWSVVVN